MLICLRGTNSSGKSYPLYRLVQDYPPLKEVYFPPGRIPNGNKQKDKLVGYNMPGGLFVCGEYSTRTRCGGPDNWGVPIDVMHINFLRDVVKRYPFVVYESFQGSVAKWQQWMELADEHPTVFFQLDTPLEVCLEAVEARHALGPRKNIPLNPKTVPNNWNGAWRIHERYVEAGYDARLMPREQSYETLIQTLKDGGWDPWT